MGNYRKWFLEGQSVIIGNYDSNNMVWLPANYEITALGTGNYKLTGKGGNYQSSPL